MQAAKKNRAEPPRRFKVLVRMDMRRKAGRAIVAGVLRYAATHDDIEVHVQGGASAPEEFAVLGDWRPDGIVTQPSSAERLVRETARAAVVFHGSAPEPSALVRTMDCDNVAAGALAARHLLRHNLRHFAYVDALYEPTWSIRRGEAFAEEIAKAGLPAPLVFSARSCVTLAEETDELGRWLRALPKPCGLFAVNDLRASHVLAVCRMAGVAVPEQVQVVGVDNEEYLCETALPPLTSIEPDFEGGGYEAMRILGALLSGRPVPDAPAFYGIRGIVERRSTQDDKGTARIVNRALEFIRQHAASGATAADAVKAAGCSASLLQRYFRQTLGRTVVQEVQRVRLERACRLLRDTETPISEIGPLCCYGDEAYFKVLFKRTFGMSMRQWRKTFAASPPGATWSDAPLP